jgi:hypothetical protein
MTRAQRRIAADPADRSLTPSGRRELSRLAERAGYRLRIVSPDLVEIASDGRVEFSGDTADAAAYLRRKRKASGGRGRRRLGSSPRALATEDDPPGVRAPRRAWSSRRETSTRWNTGATPTTARCAPSWPRSLAIEIVGK